nr:retrotransposon protein, putative, Ty1-copia subclass [Tanacetum cinerariifolium]
MLLPLGGCDMVLGIQWMETLEDFVCNFKGLTMEFVYDKRRWRKMSTRLLSEHMKDTMCFCKTANEHVEHLQVLTVIRSNTMYAKQRKCSFAVDKVEYLGHVISAQGVSTDPTKIASMKDWPTPKTLKRLRGFLGLTCYYRRFIRSYAIISKPLTSLLKKNAFKWCEEAQTAFEELKLAMITAHVLALPNFDKEFMIETDALGGRIGVVLHQDELLGLLLVEAVLELVKGKAKTVCTESNLETIDSFDPLPISTMASFIGSSMPIAETIFLIENKQEHSNFRFTLRCENKEYVLDEKIPTFNDDSTQEEIATHQKHYDDANKVSNIMASSMSLELKKTFKNTWAYEMNQQLKEMFQAKASKECLDVVKSLMACKPKPGASIYAFVLEMKGYFDRLESLNMVFDTELSINIILSCLPADYNHSCIDCWSQCIEKKDSHSNWKGKATQENSDRVSKRKELLAWRSQFNHGNSKITPVTRIGKFELILKSRVRTNLDNCCYSSKITRNIISFHVLFKDGYHFSFDNENGDILVYSNGCFMFKASPCKGIYETVECISNDGNMILNVGSSIELDKSKLWHSHLGHVNKKRIAQLQKDGVLESFDFKSDDVCKSCLLGKMTKSPFTGTCKRGEGLLDLVHTDVCGPFRSAIKDRKRYYVMFTDDFSRYGYVYLIKHKSNTFESHLDIFYKPKYNMVYVARRGVFLEREIISKEESRSKIDLEEIQESVDEEPIINTDTQQEVVTPVEPDDISLPIRRISSRVSNPSQDPQFYYGFHIEEDKISDSTLTKLNDIANYNEAMASLEAAKWKESMKREIYEDKLCVYVKVSGSVVVFLVLYVDDILLIGNDILTLQSVKDWLERCIAMKDLGDATYILGHWTAVKNILRYLRNTKDRFLVYGEEKELRVTGYCDVACEDLKEAIWMKNFIGDLGVVPIVQDPIEIFYDIKSADALTKEPKDHGKSKHRIER